MFLLYLGDYLTLTLYTLFLFYTFRSGPVAPINLYEIPSFSTLRDLLPLDAIGTSYRLDFTFDGDF